MVRYRNLAVHKASTQNGVKENPPGSNRGPMVDKYQEADSLHNPEHGYSWCASFINWCFREVGRPLKELDLTASVGIMLSKARDLGWANNTPDVGDIVCYDWDSLDGPGKGDWPDHVGIVASVSGSNFTAWEGNTAIGNDSNGGQVMLRSRTLSMAEGFIRVPGGYEMQNRYRITKNGRMIGYYRRVRGIAKAIRLLRALNTGSALQIKRVNRRVEKPNA